MDRELDRSEGVIELRSGSAPTSTGDTWERFEALYHLYSMQRKTRLRLKVLATALVAPVLGAGYAVAAQIAFDHDRHEVEVERL